MRPKRIARTQTTRMRCIARCCRRCQTVNACRDRASRNTENAIQHAHENNISGKAMEVLLAQEKDRGTPFCEDIPLVPTLEEVVKMLSRDPDDVHLYSGSTAGPSRGRGARSPCQDHGEDGERTILIGKGEALAYGSQHGMQALNAVGFFLYTQCAGNVGDEWPAVVGALLLTMRCLSA